MADPLSLASRGFLLSATLLPERVPSFDAYPFNLPAIRHLGTVEFHPRVTFIVGENGSGKSTLLEALAIASGFNAEGGTRNFRFETHPSHSDLHRSLRIARSQRRPQTGFFLRAESFFNVASEVDRMEREDPGYLSWYGGLSLHEQSHGESFMNLLNKRFGPEGLYFLDEPEAALSPTRQMAALVRIHQLVQGHSQFIIATHSPILMAYPRALILSVRPDGITPIRYEETEHYVVTRQFLNNPEGMLRHLLDPQDPDPH